MTHSPRNPKAMHILGAALALGTSLGMVSQASASGAQDTGKDAPQKTIKLQSKTIKMDSVQARKAGGDPALKGGAHSIKLDQKTVKLDSNMSVKIKGEAPQR